MSFVVVYNFQYCPCNPTCRHAMTWTQWKINKKHKVVQMTNQYKNKTFYSFWRDLPFKPHALVIVYTVTSLTARVHKIEKGESV